MKNYFDIKDKIAVITGGSSGLGFQIAKAGSVRFSTDFSNINT